MQPSNFCTHAIESLKQTVWFREGRPSVVEAVKDLAAGDKFSLPDCGRILSDRYDHLPPELRLPFPTVCLEYRQTKEGDYSDNLLRITESCRDRIVIAKEVTKAQILAANYPVHFPGDPQNLPGDKFILIKNVSKVDQTREGHTSWYSAPLYIIFPQDLSLYPDPNSEWPGHFIAHDPEWMVRYTERHMKTETFREALGQDFVSEYHPVLQLIQALACSNVETASLPPAEKLNKRRAKAGKTPFFTYKVLVIDTKASTPKTADQGGSHASPRQHLRRGHIRRLPKGQIWINSMVVGRGNAGFVQKDYLVEV